MPSPVDKSQELTPYKKKKKKKDKTSPEKTTRPRRRPAQLAFVERQLDFGADTTPSPTATTAALKQLYSRNRYDILSIESNTSSLLPSNSSLTSNTNNPNPMVSDINSTDVNSSPANQQHNNTPVSQYGTPYNDQPQDTVQPVFPTPTLTATTIYQSSSIVTTTVSSASLITTTTLTYTSGTIVHSTPNISPTVISAPLNNSPRTTTNNFISEYAVTVPPVHTTTSMFPFQYRDIITDISPPIHSHDPTIVDTMIVDPAPFLNQRLDNTDNIMLDKPPPSLYPHVVIDLPKRKRDNSISSSSFSSGKQSSTRKPKPKPKRKPTINSSQFKVPLTKSPPVSTQQPRTDKPPAIHIYTARNNDLIKDINSISASRPTYKFNNTSLICFPQSAKDHPKILKYLNSKKIEYYTHNPSNLRPTKIVVKYIPLDIPEEEIQEDLLAKELPLLRLARVMITRNNTKTASNILLLTIPKDAAPLYFQMTELCGLKVSVANYNGPQLSQCHNCQGFAHSSEMCGRAHRCVRCGKAHRNQPCTAETCTCANCQGPHPANYKGCPVYQAALTRYLPKPKTAPNIAPIVQAQPSKSQSKEFPPLKPPGTSKPLSEPSIPHLTQPSAWNKGSPPEISPLSSDNPLREIIEFIKQFNLSKICQGLKNLCLKLKATTDPLEKILIIIETLIESFA